MAQQTYIVEIDGQQYDIEGDRPPTEAEAREAVAAYAQPAATLPPDATRGMMGQSTVGSDPDVPQAWTGAGLQGYPGVMTRENFPAVMAMADRDAAQKVREGREVLPMVGGAIGAMFGGIPGAALGGAGGEAISQIDARRAGDQAPSSAREAATDIGVNGAIQGGIEGLGRGASWLGRQAYRGGVGLLPRTLKEKIRGPAMTGVDDMIDAGINERIPLTTGGSGRAATLRTGNRQQADSMIQSAQDAGARTVSPTTVARELDTVIGDLSLDVSVGRSGASREIAEVLAQGRELIAQHPNGIPIVEAQAIKRRLQALSKAAYDSMSRGGPVPGAQTASDVAVATGLRRELEAIVSGLGGVNQRTQVLGNLAKAADQSGNTGHILSRLVGLGAGGAVGAGGGAEAGIATALAGAALATPRGLTRTGVGLARSGQYGPQLTRALQALMASHSSESSQ